LCERFGFGIRRADVEVDNFNRDFNDRIIRAIGGYTETAKSTNAAEGPTVSLPYLILKL
jgi:hypothetical protein